MHCLRLLPLKKRKVSEMPRGDKPTTTALAIKDGWIYEDQLPRDLSKAQYDWWHKESLVLDGVRMGPPLPTTPYPAPEAQLEPCPFCGRASKIEEFFIDDDPMPWYVATCGICPVKTYDQVTPELAAQYWNIRSPTVPSSEARAPTPSCAECGAVGSVFIVEPSSQWFRIIHREACPWATAFAPRGIHEVCVPVADNNGSQQAQRLIEQWREGNDWPGLVWSAQNLSDEPRWLAAWRDLEQRFTTHAHQRYVAGLRDAAKEVCDGCDNAEKYGPSHKIEGSTRRWHGSESQWPCEAGGIHALLEKTNVAE